MNITYLKLVDNNTAAFFHALKGTLKSDTKLGINRNLKPFSN